MAYKQKYTKSTFPFKSPLRSDDKKEVSDTTSTISDKRHDEILDAIAGTVTLSEEDANKMKERITLKPKGREGMKSLLDDF